MSACVCVCVRVCAHALASVCASVCVPVSVCLYDCDNIHATSKHVLCEAHNRACAETPEGSSVSFKQRTAEVFITSHALQGKGDGM